MYISCCTFDSVLFMWSVKLFSFLTGFENSPYVPVACQIVATYIIATAVLIVIAPKLKKKKTF